MTFLLCCTLLQKYRWTILIYVQSQRKVSSQEMCHSVILCVNSLCMLFFPNITLQFVLTVGTFVHLGHTVKVPILSSASGLLSLRVSVYSRSGWKHPSGRSRASHLALHRSRCFRLRQGRGHTRQEWDSSPEVSLPHLFMWFPLTCVTFYFDCYLLLHYSFSFLF